MIKFITPKEFTYKKCFALFPKRIGDYRVWLSFYYKTWNYSYQGIYSAYIPHLFIYEKDIIEHIEKKKLEAGYEE